MKNMYLTLATLVVLFAASSTWAQQKYSITEGPKSESKYLQEQIIDVGDRPGHQLRIYELRNTYPANDLEFAGVKVTESHVRGTSDYTNWSGSFVTYTVYSLEDGSQIFSRGTGTTQSKMGGDGKRQSFKYSFVETFIGGTKGFRGIRGQQTGSGAREAGANSLSNLQSVGEYWIE
ncbi:MAG TPA: hypothetical protein VN496_03690 [Burkholderiales bacterium]|nr:hypothetical protein [Burkholderiales bacterium]